MALTDAQKTTIRRVLGFGDTNRSNSALEPMLDGLSAEGEAEVVSLLDTLADVDSRLETQWTRAGVVRADEVSLDPSEGIRALRAEGRRLAWELADLLDVTPRRTPYSGAASSGVARRG